MSNNDFVISVNGLASGESRFVSNADTKFFAKFENEEVLGADLKVTVVACKQLEKVDFHCSIEGTITVPCDRCLAAVAIPVVTNADFWLKLKDSASASEDSSEEVFMADGSDLIDLNQEIYDYSLLALPLQRFHKEGECDKVALGYLSDTDSAPVQAPTSSPFENLAEMLKMNK